MECYIWIGYISNSNIIYPCVFFSLSIYDHILGICRMCRICGVFQANTKRCRVPYPKLHLVKCNLVMCMGNGATTGCPRNFSITSKYFWLILTLWSSIGQMGTFVMWLRWDLEHPMGQVLTTEDVKLFILASCLWNTAHLETLEPRCFPNNSTNRVGVSSLIIV